MNGLIYWPNPILKQVSKETTVEEARLVLQNMWDVLNQAKGAGLSAIQIGVPIRLFIMNSHNPWETKYAFMNPEIVEFVGDPVEVDEGCLSVPGVYEKTMRYPQVVMRATNLGNSVQPSIWDLCGFEAQIAQHEIEHLDGKLYLDDYGRVKKDIIKRKMVKFLRSKQRIAL